MKNLYKALIIILILVILIIGILFLTNRNSAKNDLFPFVENKTTLVSKEIDQLTPLLQTQTSAIESKYNQLVQKLEQVPEVDETANNEAILLVMKDSFTLLSYIHHQQKIIRDREKELVNFCKKLNREVTSYISSKKNFFNKGICSEAIELFNQNTKELLQEAKKKITDFNKNCHQTMGKIATLFSPYKDKIKQQLSSYIKDKTLSVSNEVDKIVSMTQAQTTEVETQYYQLNAEIGNVPETAEELTRQGIIDNIKRSLVFDSYIDRQIQINKKAKQDLLDFVTALTAEIDAFLVSKRNVMIREYCAHPLEVFNQNTKELIDKASDRLSSSTQNLDYFDQEGETGTLLYISAVADKLAVTYERSYLVRLKNDIPKLERREPLKKVVKEINNRVNFLTHLGNRTLSSGKLTRHDYHLLNAIIVNSKSNRYTQNAMKILKSVVNIVSVKFKNEKQEIYRYNIRYQDKYLFNCQITLKNRASFPVDVTVSLRGHLTVKSVRGQLKGLNKSMTNLMDPIIKNLTPHVDISKGVTDMMNIFGTDREYDDTHPIESIPAKGIGSGWITLWSMELSPGSWVGFRGTMKNVKAGIISWEPSKESYIP